MKDNTRKKESQVDDYLIIRYYNENGNTFDTDMRKKKRVASHNSLQSLVRF